MLRCVLSWIVFSLVHVFSDFACCSRLFMFVLCCLLFFVLFVLILLLRIVLLFAFAVLFIVLPLFMWCNCAPFCFAHCFDCFAFLFMVCFFLRSVMFALCCSLIVFVAF